MMQGGWSFVAWAYGIAYGGLTVYGLSLWYRTDREKDAADASSHPHEDVT